MRGLKKIGRVQERTCLNTMRKEIMNLQELLGEAYNENMSIEDINNALQGKNLAQFR